MAHRRTAREIEADAAASAARRSAPSAPASEALAMLRRRGLEPRPSRPDVPFDLDASPERAEAIAAQLGHYAFRLFLRGAILRRGEFAPTQATRYVTASQAREMAEACVALGMAERRPRARYRLTRPARSFGGMLEWWLGWELARRLGIDVAVGVRSGARGVGGDLDVVAAAEGKLLYLEVKSSPPKHITVAEIGAFLRRVRAVRPDVALFVVDTALRLSDKVLPMFAEAISRTGATPRRPRRVFRETWALTPHLYAVNAREDLVDNVCRAIAEGIAALAPEIVGAERGRGAHESDG